MSTCFKEWWQRAFTSFLIVGISIHVLAQEETLMPEASRVDVLPSNAVRCMAFDKDRRIWVGTDNGLAILNSNFPFQERIIKDLGRSSIWGIAFADSLVFLGTRYSGMYVYNQITGERLYHYGADKITLIRKIKIICDRVFILTNKGPYVWGLGKLKKISFKSNLETDFPIDLFSWGTDVFAVTFFPGRIYKYANDAFESDFSAQFLKNKIFVPYRSSFFSAASGSGMLVLGGGSRINTLLLFKGGLSQPIVIDSLPGFRTGDVIWDIIVSGNRAYMAVGDSHSNNKGFLMELDLSTLKLNIHKTDYLHCLTIDSQNGDLLLGSLNSGLFRKRGEIKQLPLKEILSQPKVESLKKLEHYLSKWEGDTLVQVYNDRILLFSGKEKKEIRTIKWEEITPFGYVLSLHILYKNLYAFDNYGSVYCYNFSTGKANLIPGIESFLPYSQKYKDKIILLNRERGYSIISNASSYSLSCSDTDIGFSSDFTVMNDTLYTLAKGCINVYEIKYDLKKIIPIRSIPWENKIAGFIPFWITSTDGQLFLLNRKEIVRIDNVKGSPQGYFFFGKLKGLDKPIIQNEQLVFKGLETEVVFPISNISSGTSKLSPLVIQMKIPRGLNEYIDFKISISSPLFFEQENALKRLEIWNGRTLLETKYSLGREFEFSSGLEYGTYDLVLYWGNLRLEKKLSISLPLSRNPYFFAAITVFSIFILLTLWKIRADKKELTKRLMENKMMVLQQNLNPHFVYNSLNMISALILEGRAIEAVQVVADFSQLQRSFLEYNGKEDITLQEELHFVELYIKTQQKRFGLDSPFSFELRLTSQIDLSAIKIPPLLLQPIIENAIKHGFTAYHRGDSAKKIIIEVFGNNPVIIGIEDNGRGKSGETVGMQGTGLGNKILLERIKLYRAANKADVSISFDMPLKYGERGYRVEVSVTG